MLERKRERKKIYPVQPPVPLAIAGGEAVISKDHLRIKMPSQPPLGDFKTRSYLNYTASIPLHYNKATGYYEPAEVLEVVKSNKYGYFYVAEPTPLADSGWAEQRVNKRRQSMSALYDEDGTHLNFVPFPTRKGIVLAGHTGVESWGDYKTISVSPVGFVNVTTLPYATTSFTAWHNTTVVAGAVSPAFLITTHGGFIVYLYSSTANTLILQKSFDGVEWYDFTDFILGAGEYKCDIFTGGVERFRFKSVSAGIVTSILYVYIHG